MAQTLFFSGEGPGERLARQDFAGEFALRGTHNFRTGGQCELCDTGVIACGRNFHCHEVAAAHAKKYKAYKEEYKRLQRLAAYKELAEQINACPFVKSAASFDGDVSRIKAGLFDCTFASSRFFDDVAEIKRNWNFFKTKTVSHLLLLACAKNRLCAEHGSIAGAREYSAADGRFSPVSQASREWSRMLSDASSDGHTVLNLVTPHLARV